MLEPEDVSLSNSSAVLLIDDAAELRAVLSEMLRRWGYKPVCASTCAEAREVVGKTPCACALIDLGLPDGSGMDLLGEFVEQHPLMVPVVLTGDHRTESVIGTLRAHAFDYLTKPVTADALKPAISRAIAHHNLMQERARLLQLLYEEREQLRTRIEEATEDIRQYATSCELSNSRLESLLRIGQAASELSTDGDFFEAAFGEMSKHVPIRCLVLCDLSNEHFLAVYGDPDGGSALVSSATDSPQANLDEILAMADPRLMVEKWLTDYAGFDTGSWEALVLPQTMVNRTISIVGIYLESGYELSPKEQEFMEMTAHAVASEWQQGRLLQHAAYQASLGNIALESSKRILQSLTAILTASEIVGETATSAEAFEGLAIIEDNVLLLRRHMNDFRTLATQKTDSIETVRPGEYVEQALTVLSASIIDRGIRVTREFNANGECVLLNGTALARTFLDLIAGAIRTLDTGGRMLLRLDETPDEKVTFEVRLHGNGQSPAPAAGQHHNILPPAAHPSFLLAQRTIQACGGRLTIGEDDDELVYRIILPRNALVARGVRTEATGARGRQELG